MKNLNKKNKNTKSYWDAFYKRSADDVDQERFAALSQNIKEGDTVLDVGGGSGELCEFIGKKAHRTILDISESGLKKAKILKRAEKFVVGSIYKLPFKDKSFDVVICAETLEHLERPEAAVKELVRVSKRIVSISVPHGSAIQDECHLFEYQAEDLQSLLQPYGRLKIETTSHGMILVANLEKMTFIVDADDFSEDNNGLNNLMFLKSHIPGFKITLFTIPGRCSKKFLKEIKKLDWIDMVPHGWLHPTPIEAKDWTYKESVEYLERIKPLNLTKGFKAPGWQISDGMYKALKKCGYWVADQEYNDSRRPKGLKVYKIDEPGKLHFHIGHMGGHNPNEIGYFLNDLIRLRGEFKFIKDVL